MLVLCASFSAFQSFSVYMALVRHIPTTSLTVDLAVFAVRLKLEPNCRGFTHILIECWSHTKPMALFQDNPLQPLDRHSARTPIGPSAELDKIVATIRWLPKQSVPTRSRWRQEFWLLQAKASAPKIIHTPTEVPQHLIIAFPQRSNIAFG